MAVPAAEGSVHSDILSDCVCHSDFDSYWWVYRNIRDYYQEAFMLPQLNSNPNARVDVQQIAFSHDALGRSVCGSFADNRPREDRLHLWSLCSVSRTRLTNWLTSLLHGVVWWALRLGPARVAGHVNR